MAFPAPQEGPYPYGMATSTTQYARDAFYFATSGGGGGGGSTLQSPVAVTPDATGNVSVSMIASTGTGESTLAVSSTNGNNAAVIISGTTGGNAYLEIGQTAAPGGTGAVVLVCPSAVLGGGLLNIENSAGITPPTVVIDTINNAVILGEGTTGGASAVTTIKNGLKVADVPVTGSPNGIGITMTAANTGVIAGTDNTGVTNNLYIGSSQQASETIRLVDTGTGTAECLIGGNGGENLAIFGGTLANNQVVVRTDATNTGELTLGPSQANSQLVYLRDQFAANSGVVDVTGGTLSSTAFLRLQGANTTAPNATTVRLSTNLPFQGTNAGGMIRITTAPDGASASPQAPGFAGIHLQEVNGATITTIYDQTFNSNPAQCPVGIRYPFNSYGSLSASMADQVSVAIPSLVLSANYAGLYAINIYTTSTDSQSLSASISSIAYWSATTGWVGGAAGGVTPNGNVRIVPSVAGGITSLTFSNFSGQTITNMKYSITCLTGQISPAPA